MRNKIHTKIHTQKWKIIAGLLIIYDFLAVVISYFASLMLRFDMVWSRIPEDYFLYQKWFVLPYALACVVVFMYAKLYKSLWRYASYTELLRCIMANAAVFVPFVIITLIIHRMPISWYAVGFILQLVFTTGVRLSYRFVTLLRSREAHSDLKNRVLIIGAGNAGQLLMRDIINGNTENHDKVVAIIDDDANKWGRYIDNIEIVGGRDLIFSTVQKFGINKIYFAIPSATAEERREILGICNETGCRVMQLPGIYQLISGEVRTTSLKEVKIEDLLGREPVKVNMEEVFSFIHGKKVLVTGGGGSIGSEICRQVAAHGPEQLIIFDIYENNAYDISNELKDRYPRLNLITLIGSVRDSRRITQVFETYKPDIVYHAAAHKHVPLMEDSPCESIKNNVIGTYKTAYAAVHNGCDRFVLISTDKAVNPTNIMGASKRLCEMVIQSFARKVEEKRIADMPELRNHKDAANEKSSMTESCGTRFVAVRFGNVLGSNGSVVPLFKKQIARGGPVTVTHPDIIRYFMTIPEAVSLVLQAGTYAEGGEIFVLDMGAPVKIDTLARNLIRLSGLKPDEDIRIEYTGLRPGEKLYEEKLMAEEGLRRTPNEMIHIGSPIPFDTDEFITRLTVLKNVAYANDETQIREEVAGIVKTYKYS